MQTLWQDVRYGARMLLKSPVFTIIAVITLALGIGANTAIFSVINAVLLRSLPFYEPESLVMVWGTSTRSNEQQQAVSFDDFYDFQRQAQTFTGLAAASPHWSFVLSGGAEPEQIFGQFISGHMFSLLGAQPMLGRAFLPEEDQASGARVAILSHNLWQRYFSSDPNIVGQTFMLDGNSTTIVGVMPPGFQFLEAAELWRPLAQNPFLARGRAVRLLNVIGRLKDGGTIEQATAEMSLLASNLASQYPETNAGIGARLMQIHEQVTGKVRPALMLLFGAVGLVLLIACANVANLMLARATARRKEMAVRAALGANRARLIRQLLTESVLLSLLGSAGGVLIALFGIDALMTLNPLGLPKYNHVGVDATVLSFTLFAALLTGILFGLAPAWQVSKLDLQSSLKDGGRTASEAGTRRVSNWLVVAEMALALVLLSGAGLLVRSFLQLLQVNPGFSTENILTMQVLLPQTVYGQPQQRLNFYREIETRLKTLPDISSVGLTTRLPLLSAENNVTSTLDIEGRGLAPGQRPEIDFRRASTSYFPTLGIPLLKGRLLEESDVTNRTGAVVINEAAAKRFWPGEDAIGKRVRTGPSNNQAPWQTIVGVVGSVRHLGLDLEPRPEIYYHINSSPPFGPDFVMRTKGDPSKVIAGVRAQVRELDRQLPIAHAHTMSDLVSQAVAQRRFAMILFGVFAALAMVLAGIGIYGVISYSVAQRTRELGLRMALGAQTGEVLNLVLRQGMKLALIGAAIGLSMSMLLTRLMQNMLFGIGAHDPLTFVAVTLLLAGIALLACWVPARRATKVDPMIALRHE
jgi:putative ABC transport system permease protein